MCPSGALSPAGRHYGWPPAVPSSWVAAPAHAAGSHGRCCSVLPAPLQATITSQQMLSKTLHAYGMSAVHETSGVRWERAWEDFADFGAEAGQDTAGVYAAQQQCATRCKDDAVHLSSHHICQTDLFMQMAISSRRVCQDAKADVSPRGLGQTSERPGCGMRPSLQPALRAWGPGCAPPPECGSVRRQTH